MKDVCEYTNGGMRPQCREYATHHVELDMGSGPVGYDLCRDHLGSTIGSFTLMTDDAVKVWGRAAYESELATLFID